MSASPAEVEAWAKAAGAIVAVAVVVLGPLGRWYMARQARQAEERRVAAERHAADVELREALCEVTRRGADITRWQLIQDYGQPGDLGFIGERTQRRIRAAVLRDDLEAARKRLWKALGMPDPEEDDAPRYSPSEKRALLALGQTRRLYAKDLDPDARADYIAACEQVEAPAPQPKRGGDDA